MDDSIVEASIRPNNNNTNNIYIYNIHICIVRGSVYACVRNYEYICMSVYTHKNTLTHTHVLIETYVSMYMYRSISR